MQRRRAQLCALLPVLVGLFLVPNLSAQTPTTESPAKDSGAGWIWLEQFAGSTNTDSASPLLFKSGPRLTTAPILT